MLDWAGTGGAVPERAMEKLHVDVERSALPDRGLERVDGLP